MRAGVGGVGALVGISGVTGGVVVSGRDVALKRLRLTAWSQASSSVWGTRSVWWDQSFRGGGRRCGGVMAVGELSLRYK